LSQDNNKPEQYSEGFKKTLNTIWDIAVDYKHDYMTPEHILLGLLEDKDALALFEAAGVETDTLLDELDQYLQGQKELEGTSPDIEPTDDVKRIFAQAEETYPAKGVKIDGALILGGIVREHQSNAAQILLRHGLSATVAGAHLNKKLADQGVKVEPDRPKMSYKLQRGGSALQQYTTNLNERAVQGRIDPLIGRDIEVERSVQVLGRRKKNNPMFVGEPGVGKTAIAEGIAKRIVEGDVPSNMAQKTIFSLNMGTLVAGTQWRGQFEQRLKDVIEDLQKTPGALLFIDEIHTVIGAGSASGQALDAGNILKPALQNGDISCIGATTYQEYKNFQKKDQALMRRFQKIDVPEPTIAETIQILDGLKGRYQNHHKVEYTDAAIEAAVKLSERYIHSRKMPDKAIDVLDEAGAAYGGDKAGAFGSLIEVAQIEKIVARMAGIPSKQVSTDDKQALQNLESDLQQAVYDQDEALKALASKVRLARAGLRNHEKPIGNYLFSGPTGVGKTEAVKQLSETLGLKMQRFDMSEYMEKHAVSRLIGAPPGYVGHDQGGLLTDAIDKHPYTVLLLDEIEKAHPDIYNILLQVMDNGKLTDTSGKEVSFRNVIVIMTTNAGAAEMQKNAIGYNAGTKKGAAAAAINKLFPPEFRNRLDAVIPFSSLKPKTMEKIVDKFVGRLEKQLAEQNVSIELTGAAKSWLAREGYDEKMGARPMERLIEKEVAEPLSEEILYGQLQKGGTVRVDFTGAADDKVQPGARSLSLSFNAKGARPVPDDVAPVVRKPRPSRRNPDPSV